MLVYSICFFLSDLLHSVWQTLGPSISLQMIQLHSFLWLSNIPLYIYIHHIFLIHSSVNGHLGCFHTLAIVNSVFLRHSLSNPFQEIVCNSPASLVASVRNPIEKSQTKEGVYRFMIPYVRRGLGGAETGGCMKQGLGMCPNCLLAFPRNFSVPHPYSTHRSTRVYKHDR